MKVMAKNKKHQFKYKIYLNNKNITNQCFEADDEEGYVKVFKLDDCGKFYYDKEIDSAAQKILQGKVEIKEI